MKRRQIHPPEYPPEQLVAGPVVLQRNCLADAPAVARAVAESLDHLEPWMPWATPGAATLETQSARIAGTEAGWKRGTDFVYALRPAGDDTDAVAGIIGAHRRNGPKAIEIGYWTHVACAGRGYMSAAAWAVTEAVEALSDVDRVEIHTDEANLRSAAIPRKLGYRLDRVDVRRPEAPGESGRLQIWIRP
jgi:RimJ/RimL family protein N-acetyltransferase